MIECDFSMYLPVFLQSFVDLIQRQAMVVYRDVEMCAGVVAQTYLLRRVLSFFVANTWLLQKLLRRVLNFFAQTCFCQDLAVAV